MKKNILLVIMWMLSFSAVMAGDNKQKADQGKAPDCLEICASAVIDKVFQTGLTIKLYCGSKEIVRIDSTEYEKIYFTLQRGQYYTIEISKPGYVSRLVGISTTIPGSVPLKPIFRFEYEVEMLKEADAGNDFYLDFPVALVSYNSKSECFEHNKKYTTFIKRETAKKGQEQPVAQKD